MGQMEATATAKWDGPKLVITTKSERGEQTPDLVGGWRRSDHRPHRRPWPELDEVQEDHVVDVSGLGLRGSGLGF